MPPVLPDPVGAPRAPTSTALTAFLHGIEPRAWVFALCQGGDAACADQALAGTERAFVAESAQRPLAEWPLRFWALLLRQPGLLAELDPGLELSRLEPGPRAALLLRLLANLDAAHAAEALGVSLRAYEAALGQAMATPGLPADWLPSLRSNLQELAHELPAATRTHLEQIRHEALAAGVAPDAAAGEDAQALESDAAAAAPRPRWPWFGLGLLLLALLASLLFPLSGGLRPGQSERLPKEVVPPPPALSDTVVVTHPDYAQLAEPDSEGVARELAFLSWLAAAFPAPAAVAPQPVVPAPANFIDLSSSEQHMLAAAASVWPSLDASERDAMRANAADWRDRPAPQRAQLRARLLAWDQQSAAARARRRVPFASWRELSGDERASVRAAQSRLVALPASEQAALRAQFLALDADTQRVWWLGPSLGQQLAPIATLFAFLPEADRPALLAALRGLEPAARGELAVLAPRLDEGQRQGLRRDLLALPPEQRSAFIHRRLAASGAVQ